MSATPPLLMIIDPGARRADGESVRIAKDVLCARATTKICLPDGPEDVTRALARRGGRRPVVVGDDRALLRVVTLLHRERTLATTPVAMVPVGPPASVRLASALGIPTDAVSAARTVIDGSDQRLDLLVDDSDGVVIGELSVPYAGSGTDDGAGTGPIDTDGSPLPHPSGAFATPAAGPGAAAAPELTRGRAPHGDPDRGQDRPGRDGAGQRGTDRRGAGQYDTGPGAAGRAGAGRGGTGRVGDRPPTGTADAEPAPSAGAGLPERAAAEEGRVPRQRPRRAAEPDRPQPWWSPAARTARTALTLLTTPVVGRTGLGGAGRKARQSVVRLRVEADGVLLADLDHPVERVSVATSPLADGAQARPPDGGTHPTGLAEVVVYGHVSGRPVRLEARAVTVSGPDFHYRADAVTAGPVRTRTWRLLPEAWSVTLPR